MSRLSPVKCLGTFAIALLSAAGHGASAPREDATLLKGAAVNADNMVDALMPHAVGATTRSLHVAAVTAATAAAPTSAAGGQASLLITFQTSSSILTPDARRQLDVLANALKDDRLKDYTFRVEGHADSRGDSAANLKLSQSRAESVLHYLARERGVTESRLQAVGKGDAEPMNRRDAAAAENRRVTIVTVAP